MFNFKNKIYDYDFQNSFLKEIKKIKKSEKDYISKINFFVNEIKKDPYSLPYEKLRGNKNLYRYEVGKKYRLIINFDSEKIIFKDILRREEAYQKY